LFVCLFVCLFVFRKKKNEVEVSKVSGQGKEGEKKEVEERSGRNHHTPKKEKKGLIRVLSV